MIVGCLTEPAPTVCAASRTLRSSVNDARIDETNAETYATTDTRGFIHHCI